ncbi:YfmQ family protein [Bacillus sp. EB01]|uniref:YfmQ family protein n=1 Tax=Bacillus sp. EB01 TaxID=1347086 RepID=UPI0005C72D17|nr:YfmQ family protein [Bacillus sp. EB01]
MTWGVILSIVLFSLFKIVVTCLPTDVINWMTGKFETHSQLDSKNATVLYKGQVLEEEKKATLISAFNESVFKEKHYVWPGTEDTYLNPESGVQPIIVDAKTGKHSTELYVFPYADRIDVVKKSKKKLIAYSLFSDKFPLNPL